MFLYSPIKYPFFKEVRERKADMLQFGKSAESIFKSPMFFILQQIKRNSIISLIELIPNLGIQYCRSSGCKSRLITTDQIKGTALVSLPSGIKKVVSLFATAYRGRVSLAFKKYCANTKAGF